MLEILFGIICVGITILYMGLSIIIQCLMFLSIFIIPIGLIIYGIVKLYKRSCSKEQC